MAWLKNPDHLKDLLKVKKQTIKGFEKHTASAINSFERETNAIITDLTLIRVGDDTFVKVEQK